MVTISVCTSLKVVIIPQHPNHLMGSLPVSNVTKLRKSFLWPPPASTDTKVQEGCFIVEIIVFTLHWLFNC